MEEGNKESLIVYNKPLRAVDSNNNELIGLNIQHCNVSPILNDSQRLGISPYVADGATTTGAEKKVSVNIFNSRVGKKCTSSKPKCQTRAPSKKEVEDVCFVCFDGGDLVFCNQEDCHKAYHPVCICREKSFFRKKKNWKCAWHICTNCEKTALFMCYTCIYSLCEGCFIEGELICNRGYKGFCKGCMEILTTIENNEHETREMDQANFNDRNSRNSLFKIYWNDLKQKLLFKPDELTLARKAFKGPAVVVCKEVTADQLDDANGYRVSNFGSSSVNIEVCSSKRRKLRRCSNSSIKVGSYSEARAGDDDGTSVLCDTEWASKELLDFVAHTRNGDTSVLSCFDVQGLVLEYITQNNLRDPHQKHQIQCDSRLKNLFGKASIKHFEMLRHLRSHLVKVDAKDYIQARLLDTKPSQMEIRGNSESLGKVRKRNEHVSPETNQDDDATIVVNLDNKVKASKYKKVQICKMGEQRSPQPNLDSAAIDIELTPRGNTKPLKKADSHKRPIINQRGEHNSLQTNFEDYAAIDVHNINLLYLRRSLLENLLEDIDKFHDKVVGSFVRIRDSTQKQEMHRLVQVVDTGRAQQPYKTGEKTTNVTLEILNSNKTESIPIVSVSGRKFSEDECKCLRESIECGLISQMTVGEVQEKAMALQEARVNDEILRLSNQRDWANEKGQRKKFGECIKSLQLLSSPEERLRRVKETPEIHVDPDMSRGNVSKKDADLDDKRQDSDACKRKRDIGFNSNGKKPISPEKGGSVSNVTWSAERKSSTTCLEPSKSMTEKCIWDKRDIANGSSERTDKLWHYRDPSGEIQGPFSMLQLCKWSTVASFPANLRIWKTTQVQEDSVLLTDALNESFSHPPKVRTAYENK